MVLRIFAAAAEESSEVQITAAFSFLGFTLFGSAREIFRKHQVSPLLLHLFQLSGDNVLGSFPRLHPKKFLPLWLSLTRYSLPLQFRILGGGSLEESGVGGRLWHIFECKCKRMLGRIEGALCAGVEGGGVRILFLFFGFGSRPCEHFGDEFDVVLHLGDRVELDELHPPPGF